MLAETLYDHYKDTFAIVREVERRRDRLFLVILALLGLLVLLVQRSAALYHAISKLTVLGLTVKLSEIPLCVVISTNWVFLTALLMRYYQVALHVERQYDYVHCLEKRLSEALRSRDAISREGKAYLVSKGHCFRHWTWKFYTQFFPLIIVTAILWCLFLECGLTSIPSRHCLFDSVMAILLVLTILFCRVDSLPPEHWLSKLCRFLCSAHRDDATEDQAKITVGSTGNEGTSD